MADRKPKRAALDAAVTRTLYGQEMASVSPAPTSGSGRKVKASEYTPRWKRRTSNFPLSLDQIRATPPYPFSQSLVTELRSAGYAAEQFAGDLNTFLALKRAFESSVLHGPVDAAQKHLDELIAKLGKSVWALEAGILIAERRGGLETIRSVTLNTYEEAQDPIIRFYAYWIMCRAEPTSSAASVDADISSTIADLTSGSRAATRNVAAQIGLRLNFPQLRGVSGLAPMLWLESRFSLIDYYQAFVRALQCTVGLGPTADGWAQASDLLVHLAPRIDDPRLTTLLALTNPTLVSLNRHPSALIRALDAYTAGHYGQCADECRAQLTAQPTGLELFELYAKTSLADGRKMEIPFDEKTPARDLYEKLLAVLNKDDSTPDAVQWLMKRAYMYDGMSLGPQLTAFCAAQLGNQSPLLPGAFNAVTSAVITPRLSELIGPRGGLELLDRLSEVYPDSETNNLFRSLLTGSPISLLSLPAERRAKYTARQLEQSGRYADAAERYLQLQTIAHGRTTYEEDAAVGLFRCLSRLGDAAAAVRHVVDIYLGKRWLLMSVRLAELLEPLRRDPRRPREQLDWPLIFNIYHRETRTSPEFYEIFVAYDEFLLAHKCRRPSQLKDKTAAFDTRKLIAFLRDVCVREVMDNSPTAFRSVAELDGERIAVCQLLLTLDPSHTQATEQEIVELTTRSVIRRAMRDVGERRVHVDVREIRESLGPQVHDRFQRYVAHASLRDERLRRGFALKGIPLDSAQRLIVFDFEDEAYRIFKDLFDEFKTQFLFSRESGLNFYLSVRIRHGWVGNHLRRPFQSARLVTTRDKAGVYGPNNYWIVQLEGWGPELVDKVDTELRALSREVDEIIERVRGRLIQIRSKANDDEGLFNFEYSEEEVHRIHILTQFAHVSAWEDFSDRLFSELWQRTEEQLAVVRNYILHDLKVELLALLDRLEQGVLLLAHSYRGTSLSIAITQCRTSVQEELIDIAGWFNIAERKDVPDYNVKLLVDTGLEIVKKLHPTRGILANAEVDETITCRGETFIPLVDVMKILLDNVVEHAGGEPPEASIKLSRSDDWLTLAISNSIREGVDISDLKTLLAIRRDEARGRSQTVAHVVSREGGTGYFKLFGLLRGILHGDDRFDVKFEVDDDGQFVARVRLSLAGVQV